MTIWPQAWHFSAGSWAVKVWPQASMVSSSVMARILCPSQRSHFFMPRLPRSAGCLGKAWERRREEARAVGTPACMVQERSAAQRDRLRRLAAIAVDPGVRPALLADQAPVEQVLGHHVAHRGQDGRAHTGMLPFDVRQQLLDALPLEIFLRATEVAGDQRKLHLGREGGDLALRRVTERPDDQVAAVVAAQARRHRPHLSGEQHRHEQGLDQVVAMVAEGDLRAAEPLRGAVEDAAAQARADRAGGLSLRDQPLHHAVGVLAEHQHLGSGAAEVELQLAGRESWMPLIEIARDQRELDRRAPLQVLEQVQQRERVLAARDADQDAIAGLDQAEVGDGAAHVAEKAFLQHRHGSALTPEARGVAMETVASSAAARHELHALAVELGGDAMNRIRSPRRGVDEPEDAKVEEVDAR